MSQSTLEDFEAAAASLRQKRRARDISRDIGELEREAALIVEGRQKIAALQTQLTAAQSAASTSATNSNAEIARLTQALSQAQTTSGAEAENLRSQLTAAQSAASASSVEKDALISGLEAQLSQARAGATSETQALNARIDDLERQLASSTEGGTAASQLAASQLAAVRQQLQSFMAFIEQEFPVIVPTVDLNELYRTTGGVAGVQPVWQEIFALAQELQPVLDALDVNTASFIERILQLSVSSSSPTAVVLTSAIDVTSPEYGVFNAFTKESGVPAITNINFPQDLQAFIVKIVAYDILSQNPALQARFPLNTTIKNALLAKNQQFKTFLATLNDGERLEIAKVAFQSAQGLFNWLNSTGQAQIANVDAASQAEAQRVVEYTVQEPTGQEEEPLGEGMEF